MKRLLVLLVLIAGCDDLVITGLDDSPDYLNSTAYSPYVGYPQCNPPASARVRNYAGGSCVHASMETALFWQGDDDAANYWRQNHSGGFSCAGLAKLCDKYNIPYALCLDGDPAFLDWCMRTRRICAIEYYGNHCVNLVHLDETRAGLLDNNSVNKINWIERNTFLQEWRNRYGGNAIAPLYQPAPPPVVVEE